jgi:ribosomal protein S7
LLYLNELEYIVKKETGFDLNEDRGDDMARILIVYHSQTGNTKRMAETVAEEILERCRELGAVIAGGCGL